MARTGWGTQQQRRLGQKGWEAGMEGVMSHPPGQRCQAQATLFTYYFAFICMPLSERGPHSSAIAFLSHFQDLCFFTEHPILKQ